MLSYLLEQEENELIYLKKQSKTWASICLPLFFLYLLV